MKTAKRILAALFAVSLLAGCGPADASTESQTAEFSEEELIKDTVYVEMKVEDYGTFVIELDGKSAPITVTNFVNLVKDGFYDGVGFHRIMDGFMVQGGDPSGTGGGGSGKTIKGEFAENGYNNPISHTTGTISMARNSVDMDSASSQFFICVADDEFLDGSYAAFGHVTDGMEVVMKIASDAEPVDNNGTILKEERPIISYAKVIDHE